VSFKPLKVAVPIVYSPRLRNFAVCGARSGKTQNIIGGCAVRDAILQPGYIDLDIRMKKPYEIIIGAPTFEMSQNITFPAFMEMVPPELVVSERSGKYAKIRGRAGFTNVFFKSYEQGAIKAKGVRNCYRVYLDEFYQMEKDFYHEMLTRLSTRGGILYAIGTPEGVQWVEELLDSSTNDPDVLFITWTSFDNPYADHKFIEKMRLQMPADLWNRTYMAHRGLFAGQIYKLTDKNIVQAVDLSQFEQFVGGIDWGFSHKGAIAVIGIKKGECVVLELIAESGIPSISPDHLADSWLSRAAKLQEKYPGIIFYAGVDEPGNIQTFLESGIRVYSCKNSVIEGIKLVSSLITSGNLKILSTLEEAIKATRRYKWSKKSGKEYPDKVDDDEMDALRYALYSAWWDRLIQFEIDNEAVNNIDDGNN